MRFEKLRDKALSETAKAKTQKRLEEIRVNYLGRKGEINKLLAEIPELPKEEDRKRTGARINEIKEEIEQALSAADRRIKDQLLAGIKDEEFDVTEPAKTVYAGSLHPLTKLREFVRDTFFKLGFEEINTPHIETDDYNFGLLNIPPNHPARDLWDTLYLEDGRLLRTHTSTVQVREMERREPPIRVMAFGRCFRYENVDPHHDHTFNQFDLLYVDRDVSMTHLKFLSDLFLKKVFGERTRTRFRPKYYPFVEPGVGVDALCPFCEGKGCRICGGEGWFEIAGAGLVHPQVLRNGGIDPEKYSGLAWGFGPERMLMVKLGIDDIRYFNGGDLRFLRQFS
ncbi:phenylalanine--tRNA ligase subunit alpha [Candidatus Saccharibacteria bacterium]|nr:phenylalanine--tRNA ligase subunit alpha [Candidatus Saccharibacteria bacterium]